MTSRNPPGKPPAGTPLTIDAARYLGTSPVRHVKPEWQIIVAERAFRPHPENPQADWLPAVVVPALELIVEDRGQVKSFASIGTGTGMDILTGIEILGATVVGATDVFSDITEAAEWNIRQNLKNDNQINIYVNYGDLLTPLHGKCLTTFDVIYENLPNIPLADARVLEEKSKSSSFVPPRTEQVPQFANDGS
jgi:methylase of polypeptide subunit release factors